MLWTTDITESAQESPDAAGKSFWQTEKVEMAKIIF